MNQNLLKTMSLPELEAELAKQVNHPKRVFLIAAEIKRRHEAEEN